MKRSQMISLGLLGASFTVMVALSHCEDDAVAAAAFEDVGQCTASGRPRDACERAFAQARDEHQRSAPHYAMREDCEAEFGSYACTALPAQGGATGPSAASIFVPAMAGFLLANAAGASYSAQPLYRPCTDAGDPRCRPSSGTWNGGSSGTGGRWFFTASGERISSSPGAVEVGRSAFTGKGSATTLARGGFGARAASMGGGRG
jgi:uncharacterized protein YgiB involved in biofilm formation